mmetsp:Transcript_5323/g.19423  ORF Transcript_5323/g.19423 Transcript_5323/m.19423 type:complete len:85 (+) Transcript_5323:3761-4015(+)
MLHAVDDAHGGVRGAARAVAARASGAQRRCRCGWFLCRIEELRKGVADASHGDDGDGSAMDGAARDAIGGADVKRRCATMRRRG